jgi:hypothetical protein
MGLKVIKMSLVGETGPKRHRHRSRPRKKKKKKNNRKTNVEGEVVPDNCNFLGMSTIRISNVHTHYRSKNGIQT